MSSELITGPPGTTVLTSDLELLAQSLEIVHGELQECATRLSYADWLVNDHQLRQLDAPYSAVRAEQAQHDARRAVGGALVTSELLTTGLRNVIEAYTLTELRLSDAHQSLTGLVGYGLGWMLPSLALLAVPILLPTAAGTVAALMQLPEDKRQAAINGVLALAESKAGVLTDPATVELIRTVVTSADDGFAGLMHMPLGVAALLGDSGLGVTGIASASATVAGVGAAAGMFVETPVTVRPTVVTREVTPAAGVRERLARIPTGDDQIRVDRYTSPGRPDRVEVYIAGTAALGAVTGAEPFDMPSNVTAMAGGSAGSARAVEQALRQAGVSTGTPVVFTGYSQGGLIAAQLAASGEWNTAGLVTVGAPAGQVAVPHDVAYLAIEHTDDLVPALGGRFEHSQPFMVRRQFASGAVDTSGALLPAHDLDNYLLTAGLADRDPDTRIRDLMTRIDTNGYSVTSTTYRAERVLSDE